MFVLTVILAAIQLAEPEQESQEADAVFEAALSFDWGQEFVLRTAGRAYPSSRHVSIDQEPERESGFEILLADAAACTLNDYRSADIYPDHGAALQLYDADTGVNRLLVRQAERGVPEAQFNLAYIGWHVPGLMDEAEILDLLIRSAEGGHDFAALEFGRAHIDGLWSAPRDRDLARRWLTQAAEAGHAGAFYSLAIQPPAQGADIAAYADARLRYELAAAAGCHPLAGLLIADRLASGDRGLRQSRELAAQIGLRAAQSF